MSYWDTSCLVKLYTPERDSEEFVAYLGVNPRCVTGRLSLLEFWATVRRKEAEGALVSGGALSSRTALETDFDTGAIVAVEQDAAVVAEYFGIVEHCLTQNPPIFIRTNDALHLAAAKCSGETELVTTDKRLRESAVAVGFSVFPKSA